MADATKRTNHNTYREHALIIGRTNAQNDSKIRKAERKTTIKMYGHHQGDTRANGMEEKDVQNRGKWVKKKGKGMVLYSAISSPLDRSKRFTLSSPGRPVHSDTVLGFSWKHSSHAAIAQRLL